MCSSVSRVIDPPDGVREALSMDERVAAGALGDGSVADAGCCTGEVWAVMSSHQSCSDAIRVLAVTISSRRYADGNISPA
jgi:hypothetical protein